eukprot:CAMPEP_0117693736 /NCGR_PEP_ID=MMETSP0804-20121206/27046_1 /TAXON_ID=1074897 /ORGANISM="Tetraselmis astigmatica, Strain CCMP880" /LENGTH=590 /DNA_ID=CAMNT_0005507323 /DNA_START=73 /DNA_END=1843 /DNA_ORIENTATION=+
MSGSHGSGGDTLPSPGHMFAMDEDDVSPRQNSLDAGQQEQLGAGVWETSSEPRPQRVPAQGLLKDQLKVCKVKRGNVVRAEIVPLEDQLSFDKGFYVFIRAVQLLSQYNDDVIIVGLAARQAGSGKSAFSAKVKKLIPGVAVMSMDNYNDGSLVIDGNFDDPRLTDYDTLLDNLRGLREGKAVQVPIYDFKTSSRVGYNTVEVPSSRIIILEGIYALSSRLRDLIDLRVSITGGVHFDLVKRVLRDIDRSGQAPQEIIQQVSDTVYPMYKAFIEPDLALAHIRIYNNFNPFSGFMNATYILKSARSLSAEALDSLLQGTEFTKTTENQIYDIYLLPPGEDPETCQSWLRMRNRDGRYNLVFEEWVTDGPFIISPRISFEVNVRILGGLMALGYEIGTIMRRCTTVWKGPGYTVKRDEIDGMPSAYIQIQGKSRTIVSEMGSKLGLDGTYIPQSYIEQVQINKLTSNFSKITESIKREIVMPGSGLETVLGSSPPGLLQISQELSRSLSNSRRAAPEVPSSRSVPLGSSPAGNGNIVGGNHSQNHGHGGLAASITEQLSKLVWKVEGLSMGQPIATAALEAQIQLLTRENQ